MRTRRITAEPSSLRANEPTRRINITILESQHDELVRRGVNVSGVIRELLEKHLSESTITLEVDAATRTLYEEVMTGTGYSESDIAPHLRRALAELLDRKLRDLAALRKEISEPLKGP
jgi:hypothetical protein